MCVERSGCYVSMKLLCVGVALNVSQNSLFCWQPRPQSMGVPKLKVGRQKIQALIPVSLFPCRSWLSWSCFFFHQWCDFVSSNTLSHLPPRNNALVNRVSGVSSVNNLFCSRAAIYSIVVNRNHGPLVVKEPPTCQYLT